MKNNIAIAKKPVIFPTADKKPIFNPYNDLPSAQSPTNKAKLPEKHDKILQRKIDLGKSPAVKVNKLASPDARIVGVSSSSNNDSLHKMKATLAEQSKKLPVKKIIKNDKGYNDYFEVDPNKKKLANLSKNSADSNKSSVKSVQSDTKKMTITSKQVSKTGVKVIGGSKPFPLTIKAGGGLEHQSKKAQHTGLTHVVNYIPMSKNGKPGDDRKSWSHSNLNTHTKTNSKDIELGKIPMLNNFDVKNNRNTTGNPQTSINSNKLQNKIYGSVDIGVAKSTSKQKKQGKFIPSASKSQSSSSPSKVNKSNSLKFGTGAQSITLKHHDHQKVGSTMANSKEDTEMYTYPKILQVGQNLSLRFVSLDHTPRKVHLKVLRIIAKEQKTSIYLVCEQSTKFLYCLKKCQVVKNQQNLLNGVEFLIREAKVGTKLSHAHLVKNYCTLYDSLHIYHLLEYIQGYNLYMRNKSEFCPSVFSTSENQFPTEKSSLSCFVNRIYKIKETLHQLLKAVNHLHQNGIIHRDIKPANVLITHQNNYKLGDFGTAVWKPSNQSIGTLDYAAPQLIAKSKYDNKVDIWSLGCIAFELYVGYPPFFNENREITITNIRECHYELSLIQDQVLADLVGRFLEKQASKRPSAKQGLEHQFFNDLESVKEQF